MSNGIQFRTLISKNTMWCCWIHNVMFYTNFTTKIIFTTTWNIHDKFITLFSCMVKLIRCDILGQRQLTWNGIWFDFQISNFIFWSPLIYSFNPYNKISMKRKKQRGIVIARTEMNLFKDLGIRSPFLTPLQICLHHHCIVPLCSCLLACLHSLSLSLQTLSLILCVCVCLQCAYKLKTKSRLLVQQWGTKFILRIYLPQPFSC